jgi:hypothetical protein
LIFRAEDCDEVIDLIAWQPRTGQLASWRGQAFCLGDVDDAFNPAIYFASGVLRLHKTPLQWLLAGRDGIVIVRKDLAHAYLATCQRVAVSEARFAHTVARWLQPPKPTVEIFLAVEEQPHERQSYKACAFEGVPRGLAPGCQVRCRYQTSENRLALGAAIASRQVCIGGWRRRTRQINGAGVDCCHGQPRQRVAVWRRSLAGRINHHSLG